MTSTNHPLPGELSIASDRLALVACSIAMAHGIIHDRPRAEALLGATIPAEWPLPALRGFVRFTFRCWLVIRRCSAGGCGWWCTPPTAW